MRIIIDITEDVLEKFKQYVKDGCANVAERLITNGTPIPDNATNDDVLKALFDERGYMGIHDRMMHTKWLFAPYQKGGKE